MDAEPQNESSRLAIAGLSALLLACLVISAAAWVNIADRRGESEVERAAFVAGMGIAAEGSGMEQRGEEP